MFLEEFFGRNIFGEILWEDCLGDIFWKEFLLGGIFWEERFGRNSLFTLKGIDLLDKILVFVKILSKSTRKEGNFQSLEVREQAPSHLKITYLSSPSSVGSFESRLNNPLANLGVGTIKVLSWSRT